MAKKKRRKLLTIVIFILIIIVIAIITEKHMTNKLYKREYSEYVNKYSQEYGVQEELIYAIIKAESNFKKDAVSHQNAQGLMQLMYATAEELALTEGVKLNKENILDPNINIKLGTKYISNLLKKYKCLEVALAAYNAGSGNVDKWIKEGIIKSDGSDIENIPYKETNTYVRKIMRDYQIYQEQ